MIRGWGRPAVVMTSSVIITLAAILLIILFNALGSSESITGRNHRALGAVSERAENWLYTLEIDRFNRGMEELIGYSPDEEYLTDPKPDSEEHRRLVAKLTSVIFDTSESAFHGHASTGGVPGTVIERPKTCAGNQTQLADGQFVGCYEFIVRPSSDTLELVYILLPFHSSENVWEFRKKIRVDHVFDLASLAQTFECTALLSPANDVIWQSGCSRLPFDSDILQSIRESVGETDTYSDVRKAIVGGRSFRVFVQPMHQSYRIDQVAHASMLIVGLYDAGRFRRETISLSPTIITYFAFSGLLLICCVPVLKIAWLGSNDRLRPTDGLLCVVSVVFAIGILTVATLDGVHYTREIARNDERLETIARQLKSNLQVELFAAHTTLQHVDRYKGDADTRKKSIKVALDIYLRAPDVAQKVIDTAFEQQQKAQSNILSDTRELSETDLSLASIFLTDDSGKQTEKYSVGPSNTRFTSVDHRDYFLQLESDPFHLANDEAVKFRLQPVDSFTDERHESIFAGWIKGENTRTRGYLSFNPLSLYGTVMPAAHGFAIIDRSGNVLFHSDSSANLRENFLEECDGGLWIESAIHAEAESTNNAQYKGEPHRLFVSPMSGLPWFLVVFREKQPLRIMNVEANTMALILYTLHVAILAVMIVLAACHNFKGFRRRFWPSENFEKRYRNLYRVFAFWLMAFIYAAVNVNGPPLLLLALVPTVGVVACFWLLAPKRRGLSRVLDILGYVVLVAGAAGLLWVIAASTGYRPVFPPPSLWLVMVLLVAVDRSFARDKTWRRRYAAMATILFVLVTVLPSWAIFKFAFEHERDLLARNEQLTLARDLRDRRLDVLEAYSEIEVTPEFFEKRLAAGQRDIYIGADTEAGSYNAIRDQSDNGRLELHTPITDFVHSWLRKIRPFYDRVSVVNADLHKTKKDDRAWDWPKTGRNDLLIFEDENTNYFNSEHEPPSGLSIQTTLSEVSYLGWGWLASMILSALAALALVRVLTHKLLLLNVEDRQTVNLRSAQLGRRTLILGSSKSVQDRVIKETRGKLAESLGGEIDKNERVVVFNLESVLVTASQHGRLITLLSGLPDDQRIVIFTRRDPMDGFPWDADKEIGPHVPRIDLRESWAQLWSQYERIIPNEEDHSHHSELGKECVGFPELHDLVHDLEKNPALRTASYDEKLRHFDIRAEPFYYQLWCRATLEEKRVLAQIAGPALVNWRNKHVLRRLIRMRLVCRDPALRLFNGTFKKFVGSRSARIDVFELDRGEQPGTWQRLRIPLITSLTVIATVMFATQRQLFVSTIAGISALLTATPLLLQILGKLFRGGGAEDS